MEGTTAEQVNKELAELSREEVLRLISSMEDDMAAASRDMDFEEAARLRDQVVKLKSTVEDKSEEDVLKDLKKGARKGSAHWQPQARRLRVVARELGPDARAPAIAARFVSQDADLRRTVPLRDGGAAGKCPSGTARAVQFSWIRDGLRTLRKCKLLCRERPVTSSYNREKAPAPPEVLPKE